MSSFNLIRGLFSVSRCNSSNIAARGAATLPQFHGLLNDKGWLPSPLLGVASLHTTPAQEAARKGTRAKREAIKKANKKKKLAAEANKKPEVVVPKYLRLQMEKQGKVIQRIVLDQKRPLPDDDVYCKNMFRFPINTVSEALSCFRQTHHPTMYNLPDAMVFLHLALSMRTDKKNRFIDKVDGVVPLPHTFETGQQRRVAVLTACPKSRILLTEMGAHLVAGKEIIKLVLAGEVDLSKYDTVLCSVDFLQDLVPIKGIMKKNFPTTRNGRAVVDVVETARLFLDGLMYNAVREDPNDSDYATVDVPVGTLGMADDQIRDILTVVMKHVDRQRAGRKTENIITVAYLHCPPTNEKVFVDYKYLLGQKEVEAADERTEEAAVAQAI